MSHQIIVNGRSRSVGDLPLPYSDIVAMAFGEPSRLRTDLTITFANDADGRGGEIVPGQKVATKEGTVFNATKTSGA